MTISLWDLAYWTVIIRNTMIHFPEEGIMVGAIFWLIYAIIKVAEQTCLRRKWLRYRNTWVASNKWQFMKASILMLTGIGIISGIQLSLAKGMAQSWAMLLALTLYGTMFGVSFILVRKYRVGILMIGRDNSLHQRPIQMQD
jgi:hypothetical protein